MRIWKIRSILYKSARVLGDVQAIFNGPSTIFKRLIRRLVGKLTARAMGRVFRNTNILNFDITNCDVLRNATNNRLFYLV
uniref:Uncharacterized protein n=1 Tax=Pseudothermotoga hypogea TaxID=57487 RepID=A0A832I8A1_9THEM